MTNEEKVNLFSRKTWIVMAVVGVFGLIFLLRTHTSHVLSVIPYLILLLCPFMHIFMHKNHGNKNDHGHHQEDGKNSH